MEHVAEEVEEAGNEQRFGVESNLIQAFIHLIRLVALPEDQAARYLIKETRAFLHNAKRRYRPSMRQVPDHDKLWSDACRLMAEDLSDDGHEAPPLPPGCPFAFEELVGGKANPRDLAGQLAAAVAALRSPPGA